MEIFCFVAGLLLGVFAGLFCMSLMRISSESDISMEHQAEEHFKKQKQESG